LEQRVLERTTALATAYKELKRFADVVSHDLRAPLITVQGFTKELSQACEVLRTALPTALLALDNAQRAAVTTALEGDIPEALGFIRAGVARMDELLEAVLTLSRMGQHPLHFEAVDMQALVQQCLQTLAHQLKQRQVRVTVGPLPQVYADYLAMTQIVSNLLSNAINALVPERPGELRITAAAGPETTAFHVQDNGRGIAVEDIPKVFEMFRRLGPQEATGEGMGLAYVRTLVRRHGGDVWCQSTPGIGTTFTFTIAKHLAESHSSAS
jgi:signal transduction histidine kinase